MKSAKQKKSVKDEQASLQGSIKKSTVGKKSPKIPGGQSKKKPDFSTRIPISLEQGEFNLEKTTYPGNVHKMPSDINQRGTKMRKIKLQLFPLDEGIRMGLEKDGRNPFLELTLSARKKISSVITHLLNKWGSSSIATGELMLYPFDAKVENLNSYKSWSSSDCDVTAGDVYSAVGSPEIFRLRYSWISSHTNSSTSLACRPFEHIGRSTREASSGAANQAEAKGKELVPSMTKGLTNESLRLTTALSKPFNLVGHLDQAMMNNEVSKPHLNEKENDAPNEKHSSAEPVRHEEACGGRELPQSSALFSDLSNFSIGGFLSEASLQGRIRPKMKELVSCITNDSVKSTPVFKPFSAVIQTDQAVMKNEALKPSRNKIENDTATEKHSSAEPFRHEEACVGREVSQPSVLFSDLSNISIGGLLSEASMLGRFNSSATASMDDSMSTFINQLLFSHGSTNNDTPSSFLDAEVACDSLGLSKPTPAKDFLSLGQSSLVGLSSQDTASRPSRIFTSEGTVQSDANRCNATQKPYAESLSSSGGIFNNENSLGLSSIRWNDSLGPFDFPLTTNYKQ